MRVRELGTAVDQFTRARFSSTAELKLKAQPLKAAIQNLNTAYVAFSVGRLRVTRELLTSSANASRAAELVCAMDAAEDRHWKAVLPQLNSVVLNIIGAWHTEVGPDALDEIPRQQQDEGPRLRATLDEAAGLFAYREPDRSCTYLDVDGGQPRAEGR